MSLSTSSLVWLQWLGVLALETGLLGLLLALLLRHRAPVWRRTFCQAATLALLLLVACEVSGEARHWASWALASLSPQPTPTVLQPSSPPPTSIDETAQSAKSQRVPASPMAIPQPVSPLADSRLKALEAATVPATTPAGVEQHQPVESQLPVAAPPTLTSKRLSPALPALLRPAQPSGSTSLALWLGLIWALGTLVVLGRAIFARSLCIVFRLRRRLVQDSTVIQQAQALGRKLGAPRHVRLLESARLTTPVAFGWLLPTVALPEGFSTRFDPAKREAMLTHELAHLAARDPLWCLLADATTAVLWWHPVAWWVRRQLLLASELAADEACLVLTGGPRALAECLVQLGSELLAPPLAGPLQMAGFRSQLGRRVHRLLHLEPGNYPTVRRRDAALVKVTAPVFLSGLVILGSAWFTPQTLMKGDAMKSVQQSLKRSLATVTLLAAFNTSPQIGPAAEPTAPETVPLPGAASSGTSASAAVNPAVKEHELNEAFRRRYGLPPGSVHVLNQQASKQAEKLEAKLNSIVVSQIMFDGLPLNEVVKNLSDTARQLDPDHQGVNFLINPNAPAPAAPAPGPVDPTTGLPVVQAPAEAIDPGNITIKLNLPLRNISLKQALDAIVKVADHPLAYTVEDYAVVFSSQTDSGPATSAATWGEPLLSQLQVRTFRINTNTFAAGIQSAFGTSVDIPNGATSFERSRRVEAVIKNALAELGVRIKDKRAVLYNDLTGILMVRVDPGEMETVSAAMEMLGGTPVRGGIGRGWAGAGIQSSGLSGLAGGGASSGSEQLSKVPFVLGPAHFANGDQVVVEEVLATSTGLGPGARVVVRGRYNLQSQEQAKLCLFLTSKGGGGGDPESPTQSMHISKGSGQFELLEEIRRPGYLHVSLYPASGGSDFGGVYFGSEAQMSQIKDWNIAGK